jgi:UDP-N-acetylmuramate: L-alanyl-gamma-D-glutamyl-meso-diaminopimelate ligase
MGICGTAMGNAALLARAAGHEVLGSDAGVYPPMSTVLEAAGITLHEGYDAPRLQQLAPDLVVIGNAMSRGNPEVEWLLDTRALRYKSLPAMLTELVLQHRRNIVICGTHGKTTTTALAAFLLRENGRDPGFLIGGVPQDPPMGNHLGNLADPFVIEGDEYDSAFFDKTAKFLKYLPDIAVINNIEFDHADIYADLEAVLVAFRRLVRLVPRNGLLLIGADSPHAKALVPTAVSPVETFGLDETATWRGSSIEHRDGLTRFDVHRDGALFGRFESPLLGVHNVRNALAAIAVGTRVGIPQHTLAEGLRQFRGIKRRLETVGVANGVTVLDDFAHHPTAVHETLSALRTGYPGRRLWAVFEPRSASSCRRVFQDDFARAFGAADEVVLAAVFRSTLPEDERLSAEQLVLDLTRQGRHARHIPEIDDIVSTIARERRDGDVVVLMSNGGFGGIHGKLLQALRE